MVADSGVGARARLRILHVLAPAPAGGLERVVETLARGQAARGHAVTVAAIVTTGGNEALTDSFLSEFAGSAVNPVQVAVSGRGYLAERARIAAIASEWRTQVAHTHGYRPDVVDAGALRARGVPVVTTVHGFTGGGWRNRLYERLQRRAFRHFDAVVAVSDPMARGLVETGVSTARLHVIPNAYEAAGPLLDRGAARAALGLDPGAYVIGWVGRLSREKGLDVLLAALAGARDRSVLVAVMGEGRERGRLEAQAQALGLAPSVRWLGLVPRSASLYAAFDVFVLSSRTEGTPIALFEAMAAQVPIVASAVGGVPAVVTSAEAALVPADQPAALADGLRAVWRDAEGARQRARAAHHRLRAVYGVDPWLARYDEVYAALAPGGTPAPGSRHDQGQMAGARQGREAPQ